ncbi:MAG: hypothetical protein FWH35_06500 [Treponema sp.]|nr:hypothetical protein [Treponema sp.]
MAKLTGKKSASAKPAKKAKAKDTVRESLAAELRSLIPQLDSEGLSFLVEQAKVHLYNMQVDKLNSAAAEVESASKRSGSLKGKREEEADGFTIKGTESGSSYYLHYRNDDIMFSRGEMIRLVKIVSAKGTDMEIRERLYNWFDRERKDIFAVVPIAGKSDVRLKALAEHIIKNFKIRK